MEEEELLARINELEGRLALLELDKSSDGGGGAMEDTSCVPIPMLGGDVPWTFSCSISEDQGGQEVREGGWTNCILQLGYNYFLASPDVQAARSGITSLSGTISGTDLTADGEYVCEVNIASKTAAIMLKANATYTYPIDFENNIVYVDIGTVTSGVQVSGIPNHPVIYTYQ